MEEIPLEKSEGLFFVKNERGWEYLGILVLIHC